MNGRCTDGGVTPASGPIRLFVSQRNHSSSCPEAILWIASKNSCFRRMPLDRYDLTDLMKLKSTAPITSRESGVNLRTQDGCSGIPWNHTEVDIGFWTSRDIELLSEHRHG
jgi:hypothetical protein